MVRTRSLGTCAILIGALLATGAMVAHADDPPCVVTILNQSAIVQPDGTWFVPNVPANMGEIRAQIVCTQNGQTVVGTSMPFTVVPDELNTVAGLFPGVRSETAVSIEATVPETDVSTLDQFRVTVIARYSDGSTKDITASAEGTAYASTNPAIAEVNADGLVTVKRSGRTLLTAMNEAIIDAIILTVTVSGDADQDGLPDDWEVDNGLDPQDPVDALEDPDRDILVNRDEFLQGTSPRDPDHDDDTLLDGREVRGDPWASCPVRYDSDPGRADTDGDGLSDALEASICSDPRDPASPGSYEGLLERIEIEPVDFALTINTAVPQQVTRQMKVTGYLVDESTVDLTVNRGTVYSTTNPNVAIVTSAGRVLPLNAGETEIIAINGGHEDRAHLEVTVFSPQAITCLNLPEPATALARHGSFLLVASGGRTVVVGGLPDSPEIIATVQGAGGNTVAIDGNTAYVAGSSLHVIDVTSPTSPELVSSTPLPSPATDLALSGPLAYMTSPSGLQIADLAGSSGIEIQQTGLLPAGIRLDREGETLAVLSRTTLSLLGLAVPNVPQIEGSLPLVDCANVTLRDARAYVSRAFALSVVDVSDRTLPFLLGEADEVIDPKDVALEGGIAVVAECSMSTTPVPIYDVSQDQPVYLFGFDFLSVLGDVPAIDIDVLDGFVYVLSRWQFSQPPPNSDRLCVGRYAVFDPDPGDQPRVLLTYPTPDPGPRTQVLEKHWITATAVAEDDLAVTRVDFEVNGRLHYRDYAAPYASLPFYPLSGAGTTITVAARVFDRKGLNAVSTATVDVLPDPGPVVTIVTPREGVPVAPNSAVRLGAQAYDEDGASVEFFVDGVSVASPDALPPYVVESFLAPSGVSSFVVGATATDSLGSSTDAIPVTVTVIDGEPKVSIAEPPDGFNVVTGATVPVRVLASDDGGVARLDLFANDQRVAQGGASTELRHDYVVPQTTEVTLRAEVEDAAGHVATDTIVLPVVTSDPLTRVTGNVIAVDGSPAFGADVRLRFERPSGQPFETEVQADGSFAIDGVPTLDGKIAAEIRRVGNSGEIELGGSAPVVPVQAGTTQLGTIALRASTQGSFYPASRMYAVPEPVHLASGDMDGDGLPDFVTARGGEIAVILNNGNGTFAPRAVAFATLLDLSYWTPTVADLNDDGHADVAIERHIFLGTEGGSLRQGDVVDQQILAVSDLDADGLTDLLVMTPNGSSLPFELFVKYGTGAGTFAPSVLVYTAGPTGYNASVSTGDVDDDGMPDILVASSTATAVLRHSAPRTFVPALSEGGGMNRIMARDLDGDGGLDLVAGPGGASRDRFKVWIGDGAGAFLAPAEYVAPRGGALNTDMTLAHVDEGGTLDILYTTSWEHRINTMNLAYFPGNGDGTFGPSRALDGPHEVSALAAADLDGDGDEDAGGIAYTDESLVVLAFHGGSANGQEYAMGSSLTPHQKAIAVAEVTGDAHMDLVAATQNLQITVLPGTGGGLFSTTVAHTSPANDGLWAIEVADVTLDGKPDVVAVNAGNLVTVYAGDGTGHFSPAGAYPVQNPAGLVLADVDNVLGPDIVTANTSEAGVQNRRSITVFLNQGNGTFSGGVSYGANATVTETESLVEVGEVTGGGGVDVVVTGRVGVNSLIVFPGIGNGSFQAPVATPIVTGGGPDLALVDIDGTGALDVVSGTTFHLSTGGGALGPGSPIPGAINGPHLVADGNLDGRDDVLSVRSYYTGEVSLWEAASGTLRAGQRFSTIAFADGAWAGDVNGDGLTDFAAGNFLSGRVRVGLHAPRPWECDPEAPETTKVVGRVLLPGEVPAAGATVKVGASTSTTGIDGRFEIPSVGCGCPRQRVLVTATTTQAGVSFAADSSLLVPIPGGETDAGDIDLGVVNTFLAAGSQVASGNNRRLVWLVDERGATQPLSSSTTTATTILNGVAWSGGQLFAAHGTSLVRLDTSTGLIAQTIGVTRVGTTTVSIQDLASDPATGTIFGVYITGTGTGFGIVNKTTATVTAIGPGVTGLFGGGLAYAGGSLWFLQRSMLHRLDPASGAVLSSTRLLIDAEDKDVSALGPRPDGTLVASINTLYPLIHVIDPSTMKVTVVNRMPLPRPGDLAERP